MRSNASGRVFIEKSIHVFSGNYALLGGYETARGFQQLQLNACISYAMRENFKRHRVYNRKLTFHFISYNFPLKSWSPVSPVWSPVLKVFLPFQFVTQLSCMQLVRSVIILLRKQNLVFALRKVECIVQFVVQRARRWNFHVFK